jgi:phosphoglycerate dehydrogenase-like enzyme
MSDRVLIAVDDFTESHLQQIKNACPGAKVVIIPQGIAANEYKKELLSATICVGWPEPEWLFNSKIKLLQIGSAGWDKYQNRQLDSLKNFALCSAAGVYTTGVAEHAIAMMFALVRQIPWHVHDKDKKTFIRHKPFAHEITNAVCCVIGTGEIGAAIAKLCKALGMQVTVVVRNSANVKSFHFADKIFGLNELTKAVAEADHIFLCISGEKENNHLINRHVFASFKTGAFFYNVSRGYVVDETALYEALNAGKLSGAGLDVVSEEPLPVNHFLWNTGDNVLITGHSAGLSLNYPDRFCELVIQNIISFFKNQPLKNRVI